VAQDAALAEVGADQDDDELWTGFSGLAGCFALAPSAASRWRITRKSLACGSPIALPTRRRRACRLRDPRFRSRQPTPPRRADPCRHGIRDGKLIERPDGSEGGDQLVA
jgi:hypothetical protein